MFAKPCLRLALLDDLDDAARADGAAALADGEAQGLLHRDRVDELGGDLYVVRK
jgi:hypothetical protein